MTIITEGADDSSESTHGYTNVNDEKYIQKFCKRMLKGHIFVGTYHERRRVDMLDEYRNIIKIDDSEQKFIRNLRAVKKRCCDYYLGKIWIGITSPTTIGAPSGYNLWVPLDQEVYGSYWYKIKTVEFLPNEIRLKLETVRSAERTPTSQENLSPKEIFEDIKNSLSNFSENFINWLHRIITLENVKEAVVFTFVLLSAILTFSVHASKYLMDYLIKLLYALSRLIDSITPTLQTLIVAITKIIGGLYILISQIWRDTVRRPPHNNYIAYGNYPAKALPPPRYR